MSTLLVSSFPPDSPYRSLACSLDALPNRFPPADDESDLRLLAYLFTLQEAELASGLLSELETVPQISSRLKRDPQETRALLKEMATKGLIAFGKTADGRPGFALRPFVVGFYEAQVDRMDAELAGLFEDYFRKSFGIVLAVQPQVHRVIPIGQNIKNTMEVRPYESASALVDGAKAWGKLDCICRKQIALIGKPCGHPIDVCMALSDTPGAFDGAGDSGSFHSITQAEARQTLERAAAAGLVHCVSNNQRDTWYICNCCTCGCGVLRGMAELGIANVVARSAFVNTVDESACAACEDCVEACPFGALTMDGVVHVDEIKCVGCGVCVTSCPQGALELARREDVVEPPLTEADWRAARRLTSKM
jgi:electron transport complex protein RnfB